MMASPAGDGQNLGNVRSRFAAEVRAARKEARLSQAELAKRLGKSQRYISSVETGDRSLTIDAMRLIIASLGFTLDVELKIRAPRRPSKSQNTP
jgi:transcriptional regulator with XRE-family HTH domain